MIVRNEHELVVAAQVIPCVAKRDLLVGAVVMAAVAGCTPDIGTDPLPEVMEFDPAAMPPRVSEPSFVVRSQATGKIDLSLAGIDVPRVSALAFALASAIGGVAGFLVAAGEGQVTPMLGMWFTLKGMLAMMLGGLGSLPGAVAGGLALGLIEAHAHWFLGPQLRDFVAYLLLFVGTVGILLVVGRPLPTISDS